MNFGKTRAVSALGIVLATGMLAGCMGPTYGTGRSAGGQLLSDLDGMMALGPKDQETIDYSPRAELVRPADRNVLPAPQQSTNAANSPNWPESPEARRARIRAAADAQQGEGVIPPDQLMADKEGVGADEKARNTYGGVRRTPSDDRKSNVLSPQELTSGREQFKQRLAESKQGSPTNRKYLSEPPIAYRQPAATAPVGDPGEDEAVKERRIKGENVGLLDKLKGLNPF